MTFLKWPDQSLNLNPVEMLWHDLKQTSHAFKRGIIKTILQIPVGHIYSIVMEEINCQLSSKLDISFASRDATVIKPKR